MPEGVVTCDANGRLTHFNAVTRDWHDLPPSGAIPPGDLSQHFSLFETDGVTPLASHRVPLLRALSLGHVEGVLRAP
jgi:hypothetical protein